MIGNFNVIPLLILAAGKSKRFGSDDKRFTTLPKGGELLPALVRRGRKAGLDVRVVLDAQAADAGDVDRRLDCPCLFSPRAADGMSSSIADAISLLQGEYRHWRMEGPEAVMVMPSDLPLIRIHTLRAVAAAAAADTIVQPFCGDKNGHPVAFGRRFWSELMTLDGDGGARSVIQRHPAARCSLAVDDEGIYRDGDTPELMAATLARLDPPDDSGCGQ